MTTAAEISADAEAARWELTGPVTVDTEGEMGALNEALLHLRRPFAPAAVKWKVQTEWAAQKKDPSKLSPRPGGLVIAYIDARLVIERLNAVVGGNWRDAYKPLGQDVEECELTLFGVPRRDVGYGSGSGMMGPKARRSDAFKRAGVKWGIGVSIYAMSRALLDARQPDEQGAVPANCLKIVPKRRQNAQKVWIESFTVEIHAGLERWLAAKYEEWAQQERIVALFGPWLDHGDDYGSQGSEEEAVASIPAEAAQDAAAAAEEPVADEPKGGSALGPQIEGEEADELRRSAGALYAEINAMKAGQITQAKHRADLRRAGQSIEGLREYVEKLAMTKTTMEEARA